MSIFDSIYDSKTFFFSQILSLYCSLGNFWLTYEMQRSELETIFGNVKDITYLHDRAASFPLPLFLSCLPVPWVSQFLATEILATLGAL